MQTTKSILDPAFIYTPSTHTNVMNTYRAAGWIPPKQKYNPDCRKLEQIVRELAYTEKYGNILPALKNAAIAALNPSADLNSFSHNII